MNLNVRKNRIRQKIKKRNEQKLPRLVIFRSNFHIGCQLIDSLGHVLVSCSTIEKKIKDQKIKSYNKDGANFIGKEMGNRIKNLEIKKIVYDRSGYRYHGRVKVLIDAIVNIMGEKYGK